ncbi:MAG: DUF3656 domain-containing protein, partial [Clostridia bacterium]|nr:DUF3656 domain-containing protein [Clostridia bacterium]
EDYKQAVKEVSKTLEESYEPKKRKISFRLFMREDLCKLTVQCEDFKAEIIGDPPAPALKKEVTEEDAIRSLSKLGGTPFELTECTALVRHDLFYSAAAFNALRREAIALVEQHFLPKPHPFFEQIPAIELLQTPPQKPWLEGWFQSVDLLKGAPDPRLKRYWLNLTDLDRLAPFAKDERAGIFLPAMIHKQDLKKTLQRLSELGFRHILCRNLGQIRPILEAGLIPHGDFVFNAANPQALLTLQEQGLQDITLSYELTLQQIRRLPKPMPAGIIVYGRLPLMETENCILKNISGCKNKKGGALTDRTGRTFPIACGYDCGNVLFNATPLFLADRNREWKEANIAFGRLLFTDESPQEITRIIDAYEKGGEPPADYTRGLYYRGVL